MVHQDMGAQVDPVNLVNLINLDPWVWAHVVTLVRLVHLVHLEPEPGSTWSTKTRGLGPSG